MKEQTVTTFSGRTDIPEDLHEVCKNCIACAREKYTGFTSDSATYYEDGFAPPCQFIPKDEVFFPERLKKSIPPEDFRQLNSLKSALLWAEENLLNPDNGRPFRAWDYQRGPLLCNCPRRVLRFGRRCLPGDTPVLLADGTWRNLESIRPGDKVVSLTKDLGQSTETVLDFWENGEKDIYEIKLTNGMSVRCTSNHPFFAYSDPRSDNFEDSDPEWKSIDEGLQKGMRIAVLNGYNVWGKEDEGELARLLGYLLTDGYLVGGSQTPKFTNNNRAMIDEVKDIAFSRYGYSCTERPKGNGWDLHVTDGDRGSSNKLVEELELLGLLGKKANNKSLPSCVDRWDKQSIALLINRMFSGNGSVSCWVKSDRVGQWGCGLSLTSTSYKMLDQVRLLLLKFGVVSFIRKDKIPKESHHVQVWKLHISKKYDIERFFGEIGPIYGKEDSCNRVLYALSLKQKNPRGVHTHARFVSIRSVELVGRETTYDIEVSNQHNFVSNGIYSHNTGKSTILAALVLWFLFTSAGGTLRDPDTKRLRKNLKVLLLAPQKSHIENIFDRIRAFLAGSPALANCIDRNKRGSPQIISLLSDGGPGGGSMISGYASGDSSGNKGLSARGQDADLVVLDEGAFISKEVIENVINPILYTRPTTHFIVSSTPSGIANDYFESICTKRPDFAEFYVPATKHPKWAEMEDQVKKDFGSSQEEWDKEVLAKFSPAGIGVYREDLVKLAQVEFGYGSLPLPREQMVITFGVDWNKEHGTEIVVVGTMKKAPHNSFVIWSENIPKKKFTTPSGIGRIVELNRMWVPSWIYVDAGGGDGGQMLRFHGRASAGKNHLDARLMNIVISYDFSSKAEFREHDGTKVKAAAKQFMVENSVKRFEVGAIQYPRDDLTITRQLNNYIIARRSPTGTPVYGMKEKKWGDHRLDAMNLALVAVRLRFPSFFNEALTPLGRPLAIVPEKETVPLAERAMVPKSVGIPLVSLSHSRDWGVAGKRLGQTTKGWGKDPTREDPFTRATSRQRSTRLFRRS